MMHSLEISFLIFTFLTSSLHSTTCFLYSYLPKIRVDVRSTKTTHPFSSILQPSGWKPGSQLHGSRSSQNTDASLSSYTSNERESPLLKSKIISIRSRNLGGAINPDGQDIHVSLENGNLIAVTGETGSGKSLLVSKVADLVTGGKATSSLLQQNTNAADATATVEMVLEIHEPHLSMLQKTMKKLGLDAKSILKSSHPNTCVTLTIQRTLSLSLASRVTSKCTINGHTVTLKVLNVVTAPLLAIVDAPSAASALAKPIARLSMLDTAVPPVVLVWVSQLQSKYQTCKKKRQSLEKELASRTLPVSINEDDQQDLELLQHWVEELDGFERRVTKFCDSVAASSTADRLDSGSSLATCIDSLETLSWMDQEDDISALYQRLSDLADALKALDEQIDAASNAYQVLASLSNANSAVSAMERTRKHLMDATTQDEIGVRAQRAAEESHDLLNQVEDALQRCARFFQDDDKGLLGALEAERRACFLSVEDILGMLTEWNTLARKHGMSPYLLPSCHASLRQEMDGNVEARILLPKAMAAEKEALNELTQACEALSQARRQVANRLSTSITKRLPLLGMESSTFEAKIDAIHQPGGSSIGVDGVDFMIYHNRNNKVNGQDPQPQSSSSSSSRGGKIDVVASSGEKARILLAIECEIPGSVRALCGTAFSKSDGQEEEEIASVPPIAVIYDEIDAHVGGRAAVSLANMLSDQSRSCQVVSITHSPSVAAAADLHIVIQKDSHKDNFGSATRTAASLVEGSSRRKELARMAAGDLVTEEAEVFAEALMRIGAATSRRSPMEP